MTTTIKHQASTTGDEGIQVNHQSPWAEWIDNDSQKQETAGAQDWEADERQTHDDQNRDVSVASERSEPSAETETAVAEPVVGNGKGVAPAESESAEATGNQPIASTNGVSTVNATPKLPSESGPEDTRRRVSPQSKAFNWVLLAGLVFGGACAVFISFYSIMSFVIAAGWPPAVAWAFPAFIDIMLIISAGTVLSYKADGKSAWKAWLWLLVFSASSVYANVMHALALPNEDVLWIWGAAGLAALVPVGVFAATELVSDVAIDNPASRKKERREAASIEDEELERGRDRELADAEHQMRLARLTKTSEAQIEAEVRSVRRAGVLSRPAGASALEAASESDPPEDEDSSAVLAKPQAASETQANGKEDPAPLTVVAELVQSRTGEGKDTKTRDVVEHLGLDITKQRRTCSRRLSELRKKRPEIFLDAEGGTR